MRATYNGWANVETWRVQLHLANEESEARHIAGIAALYVTKPAEQLPQPTFAQWLRGYVEEGTGAARVGGNMLEMLARDFLDAALGRVDWDELAAHWLDVGRHEARGRGVSVDGDAEAPT